MEKKITKKSVMAVISTILAAAILTGCGIDENDLSPAPENAPPEQNDAIGSNRDTNQNIPTNEEDNGTGHQFTKFDLEVEYENNTKFEVEFEAEGNGEAEVEDGINNNFLQGDEAYKMLSPLMGQLDFVQNAETNDVIIQVLDVFGLQDDYQEFELEVIFSDGTKKKYEDKR
ncbi:YusW family protein [Sutcliffiella rhizosphaerae]|uniref:YusW-like protein n=1 Tax=Sutcliffiella rhizosphaerae TaxID=2880967 RepID=A0ABM8YP65_9BACI|nr:YusW family protein [Sutcliffiella rhizosphaerae]CAG9621695.1 hypothetical protein BACCIP111883_02468 [Sutcliffiella rhizosphaerae]